MIVRKRISCVAGSVTLLAALASVTSGEVAYAADTRVALVPATCQTGDVCVWEQASYQGRKWEVTEPIDGALGPGEDTPAPCFTPSIFVPHSLRNATPNRVVQIFEGSECQGRILGISRPNYLLGAESDFPNLTFRSFQFCAYPTSEASKCLRAGNST